MSEKKMKVYSTMKEVEKEFLPKYHMKQVVQKASGDIKYGEELADLLLDEKAS